MDKGIASVSGTIHPVCICMFYVGQVHIDIVCRYVHIGAYRVQVCAYTYVHVEVRSTLSVIPLEAIQICFLRQELSLA